MPAGLRVGQIGTPASLTFLPWFWENVHRRGNLADTLPAERHAAMHQVLAP